MPSAVVNRPVANATLLGQRAAAVATRLGVGIEIDYEQNANPNTAALQNVITAYRAVHPYDASGANPRARLTIDVAAGDRWLIALNQKATADWLRTDNPVLDWARPECTNYANSVQKAAAPYVQSVAPNGAGTTAGMLGFMFWAAEKPSTRGIGTAPPNTCEGGMGVGANSMNIPVPMPMPALRQS
ncbi:hypothetical protein [Catellatospora methionotrophica]|uniref:hypothetical protein n=1 Tax=Catellatospora methionotrophica TaxID=121620 RepID=UPI0033C926F0